MWPVAGIKLGPQQQLSVLPVFWKTKGTPEKAKHQKGELFLVVVPHHAGFCPGHHMPISTDLDTFATFDHRSRWGAAVFFVQFVLARSRPLDFVQRRCTSTFLKQ